MGKVKLFCIIFTKADKISKERFTYCGLQKNMFANNWADAHYFVNSATESIGKEEL
jgi:GTP-binding protein EngB required for normal cell division